MYSNKIKNLGFIQHHFLLIKNSFKSVFGTSNGYFYNDSQSVKSGAGFTLIELMVVVTIMMLLSSAMILNLNGQRGARDLKIAENELVSNIKKVQSYTLSRRSLPSGNNADYYLIKFDLSNPSQYTIQGMYNTNSTPHYLENVETINFPPNIRIAPSSLNPISILRQTTPTTQYPSACGLVAFVAPFAKVILNDGCHQAGWVANNNNDNSISDDYEKIIEFSNNLDCGVGSTPPPCTRSADSKMTIMLSTADGSLTKIVTINGITGAVTFN